MKFQWPEGWWGIDSSEAVRLFREELEREVGHGHPLRGHALTPIARADGSDDFLFAFGDGRVAEVHLTFANRPERPPWPASAIFESIGAWKKATEDAV